MRLSAVSVPAFRVPLGLVIRTLRMMIGGLPMVMRRCFVMTGRLMVRRGASFAALSADLFVKCAVVGCRLCFAGASCDIGHFGFPFSVE